MFFENVKLALQSMIHNKMRTLLSLLGIVIGVGSVVAIMNLGESATDSMNESMQVGGIDMVTIMPFAMGRDASLFDEDFSSEVMRNVDSIENITTTVQSSMNMRSGQITTRASVNGVESSYYDINSLSMHDGTFFTPEDNINHRQVIVLGYDLAKKLFPVGSPVGQYVSLFRNQAKGYLVVGVLERHDDTMNNSYNKSAFIPYNTYTQRISHVDIPSSYVVKVSDGGNAVTVSNDIDDYMKDKLGSDNSYMIFSPASMVEMSAKVMDTMTIFLACIAGISLLVGGIGIMNIMLVSVVERTKEIGIRKALGARPKTIQGQFLVESITITLIGGLLGIFFGLLTTYFVSSAAGWAMSLDFGSIALALGFSTFVGVFFGWYPARKAAKLDPIEALSRE